MAQKRHTGSHGHESCRKKRIKWDLPNLALLAQVNLPGQSQTTCVNATVGNTSLGFPILYLTLSGNP